MAAVVILSSILQAKRYLDRRRNEEWEAKARARRERHRVKRKARELSRRVPCGACGSRVPLEQTTDYGKNADGEALFLCSECKALFERPRK